MTWFTKQSRNYIHIGDLVFIWKSGTTGGLVAIGTIKSEPAIIKECKLMKSYYHSQDFFNKIDYRCWIDIDVVLPCCISRDIFIHDNATQDITILRAPIATNFRLTAYQANGILNMVRKKYGELDNLQSNFDTNSIYIIINISFFSLSLLFYFCFFSFLLFFFLLFFSHFLFLFFFICSSLIFLSISYLSLCLCIGRSSKPSTPVNSTANKKHNIAYMLDIQDYCHICGKDNDDSHIILCDKCDRGFHIYCLNPKLNDIPNGEWICAICKLKKKRRYIRGVNCEICGEACNNNNKSKSCIICHKLYHINCYKATNTNFNLPEWKCTFCEGYQKKKYHLEKDDEWCRTCLSKSPENDLFRCSCCEIVRHKSCPDQFNNQIGCASFEGIIIIYILLIRLFILLQLLY